MRIGRAIKSGNTSVSRNVESIKSCKEYRDTDTIPVIGNRIGRPAKRVPFEERQLVFRAYEKYRLSAAILEQIIKQETGRHIPHNRIHRILLEEGFALKGEYIQRKKEWIRYERKHSLTAVHVDWHKRPNTSVWVFAVLDDASRAILALIECESATTERSIDGMKIALQHGPIREYISDHGCQFTSNKGDGACAFTLFLDENNIAQILCRIKHPQSNGKVERFFQTYERHRGSFPTLDQFVQWYNHIRPHMSLAVEILETPWQAFERKKKV
jgi:transposase InsO family protein